jgi:hypothetical protein
MGVAFHEAARMLSEVRIGSRGNAMSTGAVDNCANGFEAGLLVHVDRPRAGGRGADAARVLWAVMAVTR